MNPDRVWPRDPRKLTGACRGLPVRAYCKLDTERRQRFLAYVAQRMREERFVGETRMVVDEEMKVFARCSGSSPRRLLAIYADL